MDMCGYRSHGYTDKDYPAARIDHRYIEIMDNIMISYINN